MENEKIIKTWKTPSSSEELLLKCIYDLGGKNIVVKDVVDVLKNTYQCDYARTTVATFMGRMTERNLLTRRKQGKRSYYDVVPQQEEYVAVKMDEIRDFFFAGDTAAMFAVLWESEPAEKRTVSKEKIEQLLSEM